MRQLLNPYPEVRPDHPLILRERRRLGWLKAVDSVRRYSIKTIAIVVAIVMLLYAGWLIYWWLQPTNRFWGWSFYGISSDFLLMLAGASLLAAIPLDYVSITVSMNSISGEITRGTWELLRLTAVRDGELVLAKHAVTQLRAWRSTLRVIGLRTAVTLIALFIIVKAYYFDISYSDSRTAIQYLTFFVFNLVPFGALCGIFIFEPLWRMRAMTALGMVISSRLTDGASAALVALGAVLTLWLIQGLIVVAVVAGISVLLFVLSALSTGAICAPITLVLVIFPIVYGFYSILKSWGLRHVTRRLFVLNR